LLELKRSTGIDLKLGPSDQFRDARQRLLVAQSDLDPRPKKMAPRQKINLKTAKKMAA